MVEKGTPMWIVLLVVVAILLIVPMLFMGRWVMGPGMMGWSGYGFMWVPMLFGIFIFLIFIGLILLGGYYLFSGRVAFSEYRRDRSLEILKERFARGEITEEQFLKMKEQLKT